jgi:hypothetical protein
VICEIGNLLYDTQCAKGCLDSELEQCLAATTLQRTFLRMYVLLEPNNFSISLAKSLDISSDAMFAKVHNARPTAYILEWFMSLQHMSQSYVSNRQC